MESYFEKLKKELYIKADKIVNGSAMFKELRLAGGTLGIARREAVHIDRAQRAPASGAVGQRRARRICPRICTFER